MCMQYETHTDATLKKLYHLSLEKVTNYISLFIDMLRVMRVL